MFNFFKKKSFSKEVSTIEILKDDFSPDTKTTSRKQSILDVIDSKEKNDYDDYITNQLLSGLEDFREKTPEFNHYRKEILDILNSEGGEEKLFKEIGRTINKK